MIRRAAEGLGNAHPCMAHSGHALPVEALEPQEIAAAIAFLAGPGAGFVSGVTLDVNAGKSAQLSA
jgi:NAD(P)-dependent dehydrogenase (short-subunit alcohol dehydrogenase family)